MFNKESTKEVVNPSWIMNRQIKDKVLHFLEEIMTEDEALEYWAKHGEEIAEEINNRRKKAVIG